MKKRLPWIGTVLLSLFILYLVFVWDYHGHRFFRREYWIISGLIGVFYGGYRVIFPDKKGKGGSE